MRVSYAPGGAVLWMGQLHMLGSALLESLPYGFPNIVLDGKQTEFYYKSNWMQGPPHRVGHYIRGHKTGIMERFDSRERIERTYYVSNYELDPIYGGDEDEEDGGEGRVPTKFRYRHDGRLVAPEKLVPREAFEEADLAAEIRKADELASAAAERRRRRRHRFKRKRPDTTIFAPDTDMEK